MLNWKLLRSLIAILWIFLVAGCAKIGDPLPPVPQSPPTISNLRLVERPGQVQILYTLPPFNVEWVEILRECGPPGPQERLRLIARQLWDELNESPTEPGFFVFLQSRPTAPCRYAVRFVDTRGQRSELSNRVELTP